MKKITLSALIVFAIFSAVHCKKSKSKAVKKTLYTVDTNFTKVQWTAYKTTAKTPVKGIFKEVSVENITPSEKISANILNGATFRIPVSSLFSNDDTGQRDPKIKNSFFGVMKNTISLYGTLHITNEANGYANFTMNEITHKLPFTYSVKNNTMKVTGLINLNHWNAQEALQSLHKACELLHTGTDGISKTWDEVQIDLDIYFKKML